VISALAFSGPQVANGTTTTYTSRIVELRDGLVIHDAVGEKRSATADLASLKGQTGLTYLSETH
jgi:hypothetical protein